MIEAKVALAQANAKSGDYAEALKLADDVLTTKPDMLAARSVRASTLLARGDVKGAGAEIDSILGRDPSYLPALTMLVSQYVQTNRSAEALSLVQKAHNAQPANAKLTASLGELYIRAGKPAEALSLLDKDSATAGSAELLGVKAAAQLALGQKDLARETYGQVLKLDPSLLAVRRALTSLLVQAGETEQARNVIKEGLARTPRNYQLFQDYAALDLNTGGIDAAAAKSLADDRELQGPTPPGA